MGHRPKGCNDTPEEENMEDTPGSPNEEMEDGGEK
jgi:hypothetical protein